ncbi:hypothetical protein [Streptomyces barkulensis]|uniref:hypothetical protein n=1 Tax=Streptomyces barkulensis TaxID=1257026 RepID=UPI00117C1601|nr:hypothetical protein [Streptomyces barkulensis]
MATHYGYLITRTDDPNQPPERHVLHRGIVVELCDRDTKTITAELLTQNRATHPYTGPQRCEIWHQTADQLLPQYAPISAEQHDDRLQDEPPSAKTFDPPRPTHPTQDETGKHQDDAEEDPVDETRHPTGTAVRDGLRHQARRPLPTEEQPAEAEERLT